MNKTSKIISGIVILLVVAGGSFYWGTNYGKGQTMTAASSLRANFASRTGRTGVAGAGFTTGTIISKDSSSITLQLSGGTGGSKIIFYSNATQIGKMTTGTGADLTNGTTVSVTGTTNSDGSVTADSIQIRPIQKNNIQ